MHPEFVVSRLLARNGMRQLYSLTTMLLVSLTILALVSPFLIPFDPMAEVGPTFARPGWNHFLGTDDLGRDVFSQLLNGLFGNFLLITVAVSLVFAVGGTVGLIAGYAGGWIEAVLMRMTEFVGVLPRLLIVLMVATLVDLSLFWIAIILGLTSWPGLARIVRAETLTLIRREHVVAARALGCSDLQILTRHIAPLALSPSLAVIGPVCTATILTEAGLGYLGLSDPTFVSWGDLIRNGQDFYEQAWWLAVFPGLSLVTLCLVIVAASENHNEW